MEKVKSLLLQNEPPKPKPEQIPNKAVARVWSKMIEIYGHKWASQFGEVSRPDGSLTSTARTWAQGLGKYTAQQISKGFSRLVEDGNEWPPSLPSFVMMCREEKPIASYHRIVTALPAPEVSPEVIKKNLAEMRKRLSTRH